MDGREKKVPAGVLAILLGGFGVHKFYMGHVGAGIIHILLSICFGLGHLIGIVEGIIYLTKSDEQFVAEYIVGGKQWF